MLEDSRERLEQIAAAVEDLIYMGAITVQGNSEAQISGQLSAIIANLKSGRASNSDSKERTMNLMYYALLIFMNEQLRLPKALTMAMGNDLENHREDMRTGQLISTYVQVLAELLSRENEAADPSQN